MKYFAHIGLRYYPYAKVFEAASPDEAIRAARADIIPHQGSGHTLVVVAPLDETSHGGSDHAWEDIIDPPQ